MNLGEAWRLSKKPYVEFTYRSLQLTRGSAQRGFSRTTDPNGLVKGTIRSSRLSKIMFTLMTSFISGFLLISDYAFGRTPSTLVASVTLSFAFSFVYLLVYLMQVLPSLPGGEPYMLLSTLPLSGRDFSLVATLSVVRTFDYIVIGAAVTQSAVIGYLTGSAAAAGLMLVASLMNSAFAIAIAVWLSRLFYRNITRGGRSRTGTLMRLLFLITWGLVIGGIWFSLSFISRLLPAVDAAVSGSLSRPGAAILLLVIHPLPTAIVISSVVFGSAGGVGAVMGLAYAAFAAYLLLAFVAGRRTLGAVSGIIHGQGVSVARQAAKEFLLRVRTPVTGYVLKDLRVASKNPSTAFIFALPLLETLIVGLNTVGNALRATTVISTTLLGCGFTLISASMLLNTEGTGLEYTLSLPIGAKVIIRAKSLVATAAYIPVPIAITLLFSLGRPTSWVLTLIPWIEVLAVSAATSTELSFFIQNYRKRGGSTASHGSATYSPRGLGMLSASGLARLAVALLAAAAVIAAPLVAYAATYFVSVSYTESIALMFVVASGAFVLAQVLLRRS